MSQYLCVDSRNEILVLSEESFLPVSLSSSRDKMQASSIDVYCRLVVVRALRTRWSGPAEVLSNDTVEI